MGLILIFLIITTIHLFGHFIGSLITKIKIERIKIGFGKKLFSFTLKETQFMICLIPIGGSCTYKGKDPEVTENEPPAKKTKKSKQPLLSEYHQAPLFKRIFVHSSGILLNLITVLLVIFLATSLNFTYQSYPNKIALSANAPKSMLQTGDTILSINNIKTPDFTTIIKELLNQTSKKTHFTIKRSNGGKSKYLKISSKRLFNKTYVYLNLKPYLPLIIDEIKQDSSAFKTILKSGDRILQVNKTRVNNPQDLTSSLFAAITPLKNNSWATVKLKIKRRNKYLILSLKIMIENNKLQTGFTLKQKIITKNINITTTDLFANFAVFFSSDSTIGKRLSKSNLSSFYGLPGIKEISFITYIISFIQWSLIFIIFNLIPLLPADTGVIFIQIFEKYKKKKYTEKGLKRNRFWGIITIILILILPFLIDYILFILDFNTF